MSRVMSRAASPQNVRVAARSRIFSARAQRSSSTPEDWLPSALQASADVPVEEAEAVPADPAAAEAAVAAHPGRLTQDAPASLAG